MKRREFITLLARAAAAWPLAAQAQQVRLPMVGVLKLNAKDNEPFAEPFRQYMKEFGWEEGTNVRSFFVWAEGHSERAPALADELVAHNVDVIMAFGEPAVRAAQRATTAIPIVGMADDMVSSGLVAELSRPGGNTTGLSILTPQLDVKRLEMLYELVPRARRIAVLADPTTISTAPQLANAASRLNVELVWFRAQSFEEIRRELGAIVVAKVEAVSILGSALTYAARRTIIERMHAERLPAVYHLPETAAEGALLAYGPRLQLCYHIVVSLVDKILRGRKPADLPIEQPSKFALVINMRIAQELGLTVPPTLLARADDVID